MSYYYIYFSDMKSEDRKVKWLTAGHTPSKQLTLDSKPGNLTSECVFYFTSHKNIMMPYGFDALFEL
jgi:hypothetical protein